MRDSKQNNYFLLVVLIIIPITLAVFFLLNKDVDVYHVFGLFFIIIAETIFARGFCKTITRDKGYKPSGEIYGIFVINKVIMILISIMYVVEKGANLIMFLIIELILLSIGLILLNSIAAEKDNNINK